MNSHATVSRCAILEDLADHGGFVRDGKAPHLAELLFEAPHLLLGVQEEALRVLCLLSGLGGLLASSVQRRQERCLPGRGRLCPLIGRPFPLTCSAA